MVIAKRPKHSTLSMNLRHIEKIRQPLPNVPLLIRSLRTRRGSWNQLNPLHMSLSNRRQCPKTNDNLAEAAVLLQHKLAFFFLHWTSIKPFRLQYSVNIGKHWGSWNKSLSLSCYKGWNMATSGLRGNPESHHKTQNLVILPQQRGAGYKNDFI